MTEDEEKSVLKKIFTPGAILYLLAGLIAISIFATAILCSTTRVPGAGIAVPAAAVAVIGNPPAVGGGPIPVGATCFGGRGTTCTTPGATCWFFKNCTDTYHMTSTQCDCSCL